MRKLIRPALFLIARLALFFAAVIWITGQRWLGVLYTNIPAGSAMFLSVETGQSGLILSQNSRDTWKLNLMQWDTSRLRWHGSWFTPQGYFDAEFMSAPVPGVFVHEQKGRSRFAIRHWLIITVVGLFCGLLKCVYRKRPEPEDEAS